MERVRHRAETSFLGRQSRWLAVQGVLGVLIGLLAVAVPTATVLTLAFLLGVGLLTLGAVGALRCTRLPSGDRSRSAAFAAVSVVAGLLCLIRPVVGVLALLFGLVLWFFGLGINDLVHAVLDERRRVWNAVLGTLSLGVAIGLATHPDAAVASLALLAGCGFLLRGALDISLAIALGRLDNRLGHTASAPPTDSTEMRGPL